MPHQSRQIRHSFHPIDQISEPNRLRYLIDEAFMGMHEYAHICTHMHEHAPVPLEAESRVQ